MGRGGARKGAGRPKGAPTVRVTIRKETAEAAQIIEELRAKIEDWGYLVEEGHGPRWDRAKQLIADLQLTMLHLRLDESLGPMKNEEQAISE